VRFAIHRRRDYERHFVGRRIFSSAPSYLTAHMIRHASQSNLYQPPARVIGKAVSRPMLNRSDERFLNGVFASSEIPIASHYGAEHLRRQFA
jgi:hypothetical protein